MFCESQGAYLLEVESQQEMDWVTEKLLKTGIQLKKKVIRRYLILSLLFNINLWINFYNFLNVITIMNKT